MRVVAKSIITGFVAVGVTWVAACGGSSSNNGTTGDIGAACDAYFDSLIGSALKCYGTTLPPDQAAEQKSRFHTLCVNSASFPGESLNAQALSDCVKAAGAPTCRGSNALNVCGSGPGTLPDGAACNTSTQCKGGVCVIVSSADAGTSSNCGKCSTGVAVGGACNTMGNSCITGASCIKNVCVARGSVAVSGDCNTTSDCKPSLACVTQKCVALGGSGAKCQSSQDCQDGLVCTMSSCTQGITTGGDCSMAPTSCLTGLCDPQTKKCIGFSAAAPGAACGYVNGAAVGCAIGSCNIAPMTTQGTCPTVIPDGQACSASDKTKVCDYFATCDNGVCTLNDTVCK
jgi:hypothetical protein